MCCPQHGWLGEDGKVTRHGLVKRPRRVLTLGRTKWMAGALYRCSLCLKAKLQAKQEYDALPKASTPLADINKAMTAWKNMRYSFRSYDPRCSKFWVEKYPHIGLALPFLVTHKYAIDRKMLFLLKSLTAHGVKPPTLSVILAELNEIEASHELACALAHLVFRAPSQVFKQADPGQITSFFPSTSSRSTSASSSRSTTLQQSWDMRESAPVLPSFTFLRGNAPSPSFLREIMKQELQSKREYEFLWRDQHVGGSRLAADFSRKALKAQNVGGVALFNSALSVSNEFGQIVVKAHCETESFSTGAAKSALASVGEFHAVFISCWHLFHQLFKTLGDVCDRSGMASTGTQYSPCCPR